MSKFNFDLKEKVKLVHSDESGEVIGRAEHTTCENQYRVVYKASDGRQVTDWWEESLIAKAA
jgi:hypothetical protein